MIHVSRSGATLGIFEEEKVREGLRTGEFIGTDLGWMEGMATWRPLTELEDFRTAAPEPIPPPVMPEAAPMAAMVPSATVGALPVMGRVGLPWENRENTTWFNAMLDTIQMVLMRPVEAFSVMKRESGFMDPLLYSVILGMLGAVISFTFSIGMQSFGIGRGNGLGALMGFGASSLLILFLMPVVIVIGVFIGGAIAHVCLMIVGGANQSFETTVRVLCYASGSANIFQVVPICGGLIAMIYCVVLNCIGLARAHETDTWRAVVAVLLPLVVCCGGTVMLCIMFIGALASSWH